MLLVNRNPHPWFQLREFGRDRCCIVFCPPLPPGTPRWPQSESEKASISSFSRESTAPPRGRRLHLSRRLFIHRVADSSHSIVFNPHTGLVYVAEPADIDVLDEFREYGEELSGRYLNFLWDNWMVFESADQEEQFLDDCVAAAIKFRDSYQPANYVICPTLACNLNCSYCFEGDSHSKPKGTMDDETLYNAFAAISSLEEARAFRAGPDYPLSPAYVSLFGGEPLLPSTRRQVERVLSHAEEIRAKTSITTNGVNLRFFRDVFERYSETLDSVQVTLDGPKAVHDARRYRLGGQGTFDEIVRGIDIMLEIGTHVVLRVNADENNIDFLPELCDFVVEKGWNKTGHLGFDVGPVMERTKSACASNGPSGIMTEPEMHARMLALGAMHPSVQELCGIGHLRNLDHFSTVINQFMAGDEGAAQPVSSGAHYWYCEQGTGLQLAFTPDGFVYSCLESVNNPKHAIGRFSPSYELWNEASRNWLGRTILSNPVCRSCQISTLCGGGCHLAAQELAPSDGLIQIAGFGKRQAKPEPHPYCAGAEAIIRSYLDSVGRQLIHLAVTEQAIAAPVEMALAASAS